MSHAHHKHREIKRINQELDEVKKTHPDMHEIFFQVFDKCWMEDGEGRVADFRGC